MSSVSSSSSSSNLYTGIYNYAPEPKGPVQTCIGIAFPFCLQLLPEASMFAGSVQLQYMLHVMLFPHDKRFALYIGTFRRSVQRQVWLFSILLDVMLPRLGC